MRVCVLDTSADPESFGYWEPAGADVVVVGPQGGPQAARALRGAERIILLHRPEDAAPAGYLANVVSGALPSTTVVRVPVRSTLLAAAIVALEATRSATEDDGAVVSRIQQTLQRTTSGLWLRRVTRLTTPNPSFGQHLRSVFPWGPGFVALLGPEPTVLGARGPVPPQPPGTRLVIGAAEGNKGFEQLTAWCSHGSGGAVHAVPGVAPVLSSARRAHGNDGIEFVLLQPSLAEPAPAGARCRVCRLPVRASSCPFCHVVPRVAEVGRA